MAKRKAAEVNTDKELTAADIAAAEDIKIERVDVPEWGGHIYVRTMTQRAKEKYVESVREIVGQGKNQTEKVILEESGAKLAIATVCDKNGKLILNKGMQKMLADKSAKAMQRVVDKASEMNGLNDDAVADAKNDSAGEDQNDDSSTD